jgi:hypothetical protein
MKKNMQGILVLLGVLSLVIILSLSFLPSLKALEEPGPNNGTYTRSLVLSQTPTGEPLCGESVFKLSNTMICAYYYDLVDYKYIADVLEYNVTNMQYHLVHRNVIFDDDYHSIGGCYLWGGYIKESSGYVLFTYNDESSGSDQYLFTTGHIDLATGIVDISGGANQYDTGTADSFFVGVVSDNTGDIRLVYNSGQYLFSRNTYLYSGYLTWSVSNSQYISTNCTYGSIRAFQMPGSTAAYVFYIDDEHNIVLSYTDSSSWDHTYVSKILGYDLVAERMNTQQLMIISGTNTYKINHGDSPVYTAMDMNFDRNSDIDYFSVEDEATIISTYQSDTNVFVFSNGELMNVCTWNVTGTEFCVDFKIPWSVNNVYSFLFLNPDGDQGRTIITFAQGTLRYCDIDAQYYGYDIVHSFSGDFTGNIPVVPPVSFESTIIDSAIAVMIFFLPILVFI